MRVIIAAGAIALALGACATNKQWVKDGADQNRVASDKFWCSRDTVEKFEQFNAPMPGRRVERNVDPECMRNRGYRYE